MSAPQPTTRNPWTWVPTLYLAQGLPFAVANSVSVILYKSLGVSNADIAFYTAWLYLPWVLQPLWSPAVDLLKTRRLWIWATQLLLGAGFAAVGLSMPLPIFFKATLVLFYLVAFSSATHDIAADGFYMLDRHHRISDVPSAIEAMKTGVADYLPKPFTDDELISSIREALSRGETVSEAQSGEFVEERIEKLIPKGEVIRALTKASEDDDFLHHLAERTRITPGELSLIAEHMHELTEEHMGLLCKRLQFHSSTTAAAPGDEEPPDSELERAQERSPAVNTPGDYTTVIEEKWMDTAEQLARNFNFPE